MENLNEGKKAKGYMAELAEIDKQSALVALEAKINKLAEMAEAKTARLAMVNEDENLSELISKQAVKEMQRSIKEIEKLKEKLLKEFTKKGGKMTEVIDEEVEQERDYEDAMKDDKAEMEEGYGSTTYEEDDPVNEDFEDVVDDIMDQGKSREDAEKIAGAINRDHVGRYRQEESLEETNEEVNRWQKLAGL